MKINIIANAEYWPKTKKWYLVFYWEYRSGATKMYAAIFCKNRQEAKELERRINDKN